MAIETNIGHAKQALDFINANQNGLYFVLGKPQDWADSNNPDPEDEATTGITNPQALVQVDRLVLCYETNEQLTDSAADGDDYIVYKGKKWQTISPDAVFNNSNQLTQNACYVCLIGELEVESIAPFSFTQIGVTQNAEIATNAPDTHQVSKENVINWGQLYFYENRMKENYTTSQAKIFKYLLKF